VRDGDTAISPDWRVHRVYRASLGPLEPFDQGGEGTLYRVTGMTGPFGTPILYKEYRSGRVGDLDGATLDRFPVFARSLSETSLGWLYQRASWPAWIVDDSDTAAGVLIPLAPEVFMTELHRPSGGRRRVPAKFELLLNGRAFLENVGLDISMRQRIQLLVAVAETMAFFHSHAVAVGDFSCKNVLFSLWPRPACYFIDCDSMAWDGRTALPAGETPEWELLPGETLATTTGDVYKFALLVLRMHTGAQHHRDAARLPAQTWPALRAMVERTLAGPANDRPLITEWIQPLRAAAEVAAASSPGAPAKGPPSTPPSGPPSTPLATPPTSHRTSSTPHPMGAGPTQPALTVEAVTAVAGAVLRRVLLRRSASPSVAKMAIMLIGLWVACAAAFGLAWLAGMDPGHMTATDEAALYTSFGFFALIAFMFGTTEAQ
jgi:hypothetical protein